MTRDEKIGEAKRMRAYGLSREKIAFVLSMGASTIYRWLDPAVVAKDNEITRRSRAADPEKHRTWNRDWVNRNREHRRKQKRDGDRERRAESVDFRIAENLRSRIGRAIRKGYKTGSAVRDLGCAIPDFKLHIEALFQPGMTWTNWGEWHLDHIKPLASFDLKNREQFLAACHYTNMQPLWAVENMRKSDKIVTVAYGIAV